MSAINPGFHSSVLRRRVALIVRLLLLTAFIGVGAKALFDLNLSLLAETGPRGWGTELTPDASTDAYLHALLRNYDHTAMAEIRRPTERIRAAISALPENEAIVFTGNRQEVAYGMVWLILSRLSWPRPVYDLACDGQASFLQAPSDARVSAIIYFLAEPHPALPQSRSVLPRMTMTSLSRPDQWNTLCSR
jgi:hypothetical protein